MGNVNERKTKELLVKCLEMTGSDQDGEALAAIRKANTLLKKLGKRWTDVVEIDDDDPFHAPPQPQTRRGFEQGRPFTQNDMDDIMEDLIRRMYRSRGSQNPFNHSFYEQRQESPAYAPKSKTGLIIMLETLMHHPRITDREKVRLQNIVATLKVRSVVSTEDYRFFQELRKRAEI